MTDRSLRDGLRALVDNEPPLHVDLTPVIEEGRRLRRRQRAVRSAVAVCSTVALVTSVAVPLALTRSGSSHLRTSDVVAFQPLAGATMPSEDGGSGTEQLTPREQRIADAITAASPEGWTFDLGADRWQDPNNVEGTADDGSGPGRLLVGISKPVGSQQVHPCDDSEFVQGATCTERMLPDGAILSLRGLVDSHGVEYVDVALTHPDGTGVSAEAANFTLTWPLPAVITAGTDKRDLIHVTRAVPPYTVEQLGKVVVAVDAVTR